MALIFPWTPGISLQCDARDSLPENCIMIVPEMPSMSLLQVCPQYPGSKYHSEISLAEAAPNYLTLVQDRWGIGDMEALWSIAGNRGRRQTLVSQSTSQRPSDWDTMDLQGFVRTTKISMIQLVEENKFTSNSASKRVAPPYLGSPSTSGGARWDFVSVVVVAATWRGTNWSLGSRDAAGGGGGVFSWGVSGVGDMANISKLGVGEASPIVLDFESVLLWGCWQRMKEFVAW